MMTMTNSFSFTWNNRRFLRQHFYRLRLFHYASEWFTCVRCTFSMCCCWGCCCCCYCLCCYRFCVVIHTYMYILFAHVRINFPEPFHHFYPFSRSAIWCTCALRTSVYVCVRVLHAPARVFVACASRHQTQMLWPRVSGKRSTFCVAGVFFPLYRSTNGTASDCRASTHLSTRIAVSVCHVCPILSRTRLFHTLHSATFDEYAKALHIDHVHIAHTTNHVPHHTSAEPMRLYVCCWLSFILWPIICINKHKYAHMHTLAYS